jgi:hypothetical protein
MALLTTPGPVRRVSPFDSSHQVTMDRRTPSDWPLAPERPQEKPTLFQQVSGALRRLRGDGSYGTINAVEESIPRAPVLGATTGAVIALREANVQLNKFRIEVGDLHNRAASHHMAAQQYDAAVQALKQLEQADVDISAAHALNGTVDHEAAERAQGIATAEKAVTAAHRARQIGSAAIIKNDAAVSAVTKQVTALEFQIKHLTGDALREMLTELAPLVQRTSQAQYAITVHWAGICKALASLVPQIGGDTCGSGLENHLSLPTPEHPAYGFKTVPNLHVDVTSEMQRIMEALKA